MKSKKQPDVLLLLAIVFLISAALAIFQTYYFNKDGDNFFSSLQKHIPWSSEETQKVADAGPTVKLTVNPSYDGSNKEYIYADSADEEAVVRIHQMVTYQYYGSNGSAIRTVETKSYNAHGEVLFSDYKRESCKMADTSITGQEIEINYLYEPDTIHRNYTLSSYAGTVCQDSVSELSEKDRT